MTNLNEPIRAEHDEPDVTAGPREGIALCLSGGGYRAMLFHVGALWRLNDAGYLPRIARYSSVSGGSIAAAALATAWTDLDFDAVTKVAKQFGNRFVDAVRTLASHTIDAGAVLSGALLPGRAIATQVERAYHEHLFGARTLQDLPSDPRFIFNATNVQTGALFRFSRPYLADWRLGMVDHPTVPLAAAVAASSAFPPVLSPFRLPLKGATWRAATGDLTGRAYRRRPVLTDGGVYDNLGLETAWKAYRTVLVSDGGGQMADDPRPARDWVRHSMRVTALLDHQVRNLRKRQVISSYQTGTRTGTYWGIRTNIADYGLADPLLCDHNATMRLAVVATRLKTLDATTQERLINWGFAVCDAAMRRWVDPALARPTGFPYPSQGVG